MKSVFIYCPTEKLFHTTACLIQGFEALNFKIKSNARINRDIVDSRGISRPFSITDPPFIERAEPTNTDIVLIDVTHGFGDLDNLNRLLENKYALLINMSDHANFQDYTSRVNILTAHKNNFVERIGNFYPMPFGLSSDIIHRHRSLSKSLGIRENIVLSNFKPSLAQGVRNFLSLSLEEAISKSGNLRRGAISQDKYPDFLTENKFICTYGGDIYRDLRLAGDYGDDPFFGNNTYAFKKLEKECVILRWDSWRVYEAGLFGCIPLMLDYDIYGFSLNSTPPQELYINIDMSNMGASLSKLEELILKDNMAEDISKSLSEWFLDKYCPEALASHTLNIIDSL